MKSTKCTCLTATNPLVRQSGFSILEMLFATVILLVGLVAVAQLVPASIFMNYHNRTDSAVMVFAQRQLDVLLDQPLNPPGNSFVDQLGNIYQLGDPTAPNVLQGSNVVTLNGYTVIDFSGALPPAYPANGYSFTYLDPTDPNGATYDVRWAVIITGNGANASSKRFILGVRQIGQQRAGTFNSGGFSLPITLDTMVSR